MPRMVRMDARVPALDTHFSFAAFIMDRRPLSLGLRIESGGYEMDSKKVALVDQTTGGVVPPADLQRYRAVLQQQVDNHLAPAWQVRADISVLASGDQIPPDTWPIRIVDSVPFAQPGEFGVHLDDQGQPYAQVVNADPLSITISHELLEMLVDPLGTRLMQAADLDPYSDGHPVQYLVELCDPCQVSSYLINGLPVADFILPSFYDPSAHGRVDFLATLATPSPQTVPIGCCISWFDRRDRSWHEQQLDGNIVKGTETLGYTRADRDFSLAEANPDRHNIPAIYRAWPQEVKCLPWPT
jgi:hypothetical protein